MRKSLCFLFFLLSLQICSLAQGVPVDLAPIPGPFLYTNGPNTGGALAFGCVFTFITHTTSPLETYTDASGNTQNQNPVVLNAGGYASIWFKSGHEYSIKVVANGGINCASGTTQYTVDNVNASLLNLQNTWQQTQSFDLPIQLFWPDLQIQFGAPTGTRTTLDIPPTSSDVILHGPPLTADDTLLSANATQTVKNKNLTTGTQVNGCGMTNGPGTYICIANNSVTATALNQLAILVGGPTSTATVAPIGTKVGVQGIVASNAGITGTAIIQQSGDSQCQFDTATTAGDYFIPSPIDQGFCSDTGFGPPAPLPNNAQVMGQVLVTNLSTGLYPVSLYGNFGSGVKPGTPTVTAFTGAGSGATVSVASGSSDKSGQILLSSGLSPTGSAEILSLNFSVTYTPFLFCVFFPSTGASAIANTGVYVLPAGPSSALIAQGAITASTSYGWTYSCN